MFEDGVLAGIVNEVATGLRTNQLNEGAPTPVRTTKAPENNFTHMRQEAITDQKQKVNTNRKKLLEAVGRKAYNGVNLFEGTAPLADKAPPPGSPPTPGGPLANVEASDPGVDISNLFGAVGTHWKAHMEVGK
jgi:hypothetical protein